eukprot:15436241-Alexandrium_andersonii.AAC.1
MFRQDNTHMLDSATKVLETDKQCSKLPLATCRRPFQKFFLGAVQRCHVAKKTPETAQSCPVVGEMRFDHLLLMVWRRPRDGSP